MKAGVHIFDDGDMLARAAAEHVLEAGRQSFAARGVFRLGLSGGRTPEHLYALLAKPPFRERLIAAGPIVLFADERAVAPDHPDSNYAMARAALLAPAGIRAASVQRMRGEAESLDDAAREYEALLAEPIDLLILGIGADGHTASIFPSSAAAHEKVRRVLPVVDSPKPPPRRLTITPRVISEARSVAVIATGTGKAGAVARAFDEATDPVELPARLLRDCTWFLDADAAELL
ncbi:MAG TPA: 6-phosphogluconolactonase [Candidatus Binatia bacterium]|nr:6-phosphogluconolactonase [Candidatus Binatia bacterium]